MSRKKLEIYCKYMEKWNPYHVEKELTEGMILTIMGLWKMREVKKWGDSLFLDIVKLGVRFLPEKPEGRFYVAKNRLYSHHLSFLCDKPGKQLPCLHEQIFAGQVQRAAEQQAVRIAVIARRNRKDQIRSFIEKWGFRKDSSPFGNTMRRDRYVSD